jgi:2-keto-4-pentenoate hydratase/2-oxohepta-3-ene-1,7-dioic acid hydratase in catechol pathway
MRVAMISNGARPTAASVKEQDAWFLAFGDVRELLHGRPDPASHVLELADRRVPLRAFSLAARIPAPHRIGCVDVNYRAHAAEAGLEIPHPPRYLNDGAVARTVLDAVGELVTRWTTEDGRSRDAARWA